jgi:hypothetical protein
MNDDGLVAAPLGDLITPRRIGLAWSNERVRLPGQERLAAVAAEVCAAIASDSRAPTHETVSG